MKSGKIKGSEILLVAAAGCAAMVLPVALDPLQNPFRTYDGPFFPIMSRTVEEMKGISVILIALVGLAAGRLLKSPAWLLGFSTMAVFPVWSLLDAIMGGSHNLLPIEWAIYFGISLFGLVGALLGRFTQKRF